MHNRFHLVILLFLCFCSGQVLGLEIGIEGELSGIASDNAFLESDTESEDSYTATGRLGIFGEQSGQMFAGWFLGEVTARKDLEDSDVEYSTLTNFLGALDVQFSPAFSWYMGDIIGGVRVDNAVIPSDDLDLVRRNIFATGPTFFLGLDTSSTVESSLLYITQFEEDQQLDQIYNGSVVYRRDAGSANSWGLSFTDSYVDNLDNDNFSNTNRVSISAFAERRRDRFTYTGGLGVTRYDTDEDSVSGLNANLGYEQQLGPLTSWNFSLSHDLLDETLATIDSFADDGVGEEPEVDGIFNESRISISYRYLNADTIFDVGASSAQSNYEILNGISTGDASAEDQLQSEIFSSFQYSFNSRLRSTFFLRYEMQEDDNRIDNIKSVLVDAAVFLRLTRSIEVSLGYLFNQADGIETVITEAGSTLEDIDYVENRATISIIWAPPTRVNREPLTALRQLLQ